MYTGNITHAKTLAEFYHELRGLQEKHSGDHYCAVHDALTGLMEDCKIYKELGVKQGTTLAAVMLTNPKLILAIDRSLDDYKPYKKLFETYATENNIKFDIKETDSTSFISTAISCDLLFIDTQHVYSQLKKELNAHHAFVNKYIVMHDTHAKPEMLKAIEQFVEKNKKWKIKEINKQNVGYTVLEKAQ